MGMELQYTVNLLATLPKNNTSDAVNNSDDSQEFFKKRLQSTLTDLDQLQDSMDRLLEQYNRESVRKTMLKHEKIFKEQVWELHRLYRVQKMLMAELRSKDPKLHPMTNPSVPAIRVGPNSTDTDNRTRFWSSGTNSETNQFPFSKWNQDSPQTNSGHNFHQLYSVRDDQSSQEQSSSCSRDTFRRPRGFDLERPADQEDITTELSAIEDQAGPSSLRSSKDKMSIDSSHDPRFYTDGESEVELTLSIGFGTSEKIPKNCQSHPSQELGCTESNHNKTKQMDPSMSVRSDRGEECSDPTNSIGTASATFEQESLQRPPWLFQTLSLNRM